MSSISFEKYEVEIIKYKNIIINKVNKTKKELAL